MPATKLYFETLVRLHSIYIPCPTIPYVGIDVTFTVVTYASNVGLAVAVVLQDQGAGGSQPVAYWAQKMNAAEGGNNYYAYDFEALAMCEYIKH